MTYLALVSECENDKGWTETNGFRMVLADLWKFRGGWALPSAIPLFIHGYSAFKLQETWSTGT